MRIVLTHPFCWPYTRRGTERHLDLLAKYLTAQGHEVFTVSTKPGAGCVESTVNGKRILHSQVQMPVLKMLRIEPPHAFLLRCLRTIPDLEAAVVHSFHFTDAFAAIVAKRWSNYQTVLQINGTPIPRAFHRWPPDRWMIKHVIRKTDQLVVPSQYVRQLIRECYGTDAQVAVIPIDVETFTPGSGPPDARPTILSVADFEDRRKGVRVLVAAFQLIKQTISDARLRLAGRLSPDVREELLGSLTPSLHADVEFLGIRDTDLPRLYQEASVMVLPSMWEASGTAMFESWSCGTPVVVTNHAGLPEFMGDGVGVLFDPKTTGFETDNAQGLAEAILQGLALADDDGTRATCRSHAEQYSWAALGPQIAKLYS